MKHGSNFVTIRNNFRRGVSLNPKGKCLGTRFDAQKNVCDTYFWEDYSTVNTKVMQFGAGLRKIGVKTVVL